MGLSKKKKMNVSLLHFVSPCLVTSFEQVFWSVSEIFLYILFVSFVTKQKWAFKKKNTWLRKVSVSLLHYVTPCFVTSTDQGV